MYALKATIPSDQSGILATARVLKNIPGEVIKQDKYVFCSGTSQATANLTGVLALIKSILNKKQLRSPFVLERIILESADGNYKKEVNANKATQLASQLINAEADKPDDDLPSSAEFARSMYSEGNKLIQQQSYLEALSIFKDVEKLGEAPKIRSDDWNSICWFGIRKYGAEGKKENIVRIIPACNKGVKLEEKPSSKDSVYNSFDYYMHLDSLATAKAITGDFQGAANDFSIFVKDNPMVYQPGCPKFIEERRKFIPMLRRGINPFTPEKIKKLPSSGC